LPSPVSIAKIYFFARDPNHPYNSRHPVPVEGRWPSSRTLGRVAVDAAASGAWSCSQGGLWSVSGHNVRTTGEAAYGKAVWSWHPLLVSSWRRSVDPTGFSAILQSAGDGGKRNSSPGRARYKPSNHCAGNAGVLQLYLYARVRILTHSCTRDRGCSKHPAFPAPSSSGRMNLQTSGASRRENADTHSLVIARLDRAPSIPEAVVIEPMSRGVLPRMRGDDDPLCGEWIASLATTLLSPKAAWPLQLRTIRNNSLLQVSGDCAFDGRL
jgi:hypothetical protein